MRPLAEVTRATYREDRVRRGRFHTLITLLLGLTVVGVVGVTQARVVTTDRAAAAHQRAWLDGAGVVVAAAEVAPAPPELLPPHLLAPALPATAPVLHRFAPASPAPLDGAPADGTPLHLRTVVLLL